MEIYPVDFDDYKAFLVSYFKHLGQRGAISAMAKAADCQRSYLSQVLNTHVHLTPDQALAISYFLNCSDQQARYFCLLVDLARASSANLKARIRDDLLIIKKDLAHLGKRFAQVAIEPGEREIFYYSSWLYAAVHVLTTVPKLKTADAIAAHLGVGVMQIETALKDLERHRFVQKDEGRWTALAGDLHVPAESLLNLVNHSNWRNRAVADAQARIVDSIHYTSVASLSKSDADNLRHLITNFIDKSRKIISESPEETAFCTLIDFFKV